MSERIVEALLTYSERHPYYLNLLCSCLFSNERPPTINMVAEAWHQYMVEERSNVASELGLLAKIKESYSQYLQERIRLMHR